MKSVVSMLVNFLSGVITSVFFIVFNVTITIHPRFFFLRKDCHKFSRFD